MYVPKHTLETDIPTLHAFMDAHNFAILFSSRDNQPMATHLPFMLDATRGTYGTLIAHFAKANPHFLVDRWNAFGAVRSVMKISR